MPPPWKVKKHFLTRYTVKNGISNLYILLKSALKMQEMPFQRPKFQKISLQLCRHYGLLLTKILATPLAVLSALKKLNPHKASGPDGIPNWLMRGYAEILAPPVSSVLSSSFVEQRLPPSWKQADVVPTSTSNISDSSYF